MSLFPRFMYSSCSNADTKIAHRGKHALVALLMIRVPWNGDIIQPRGMNRYFYLASAEPIVPNMEAWGLLWDFQTLRELVDTLPGNTPCVFAIKRI